MDGPWESLRGAGCQGVAFATICITEDERVLTNCLASLCALLATSDPGCVIAFVSRWVYQVARSTLLKSGVVPVLAPEWAPLPSSHPYAHLQDRTYTFAKLEAFRLTQFERVVTFDIDVLFMRSAASLRQIPAAAFAAARIPKGKVPAQYVQTGVMVLKPSVDVYNQLVYAWRQGDYKLHFSDSQSTEQDVIIDLCVIRGVCGSFVDLDACIYNHGSWIPKSFWRPCAPERVVARHNFNASRELVLAGMLQTAMYRGTCRAHTDTKVIADECWREDFTWEECCATQRSRWGNSQCWGGGLSYERCCVGVSDSQRLRRELAHVGESWYGLSSIPDSPTRGWLGDLCWRQYVPLRRTFAGMSSIFYPMPRNEQWLQISERAADELPAWSQAWAYKCEGMGSEHIRERVAVYVSFRFRFPDYFRRFGGHPVVQALHSSIQLWGPHEQRAFEGISTCVPKECCMHQPKGVNSSIDGLRAVVQIILVLWSFITDFLFNLHEVSAAEPPERFEGVFQGPLETIPAPSARDFEDISTFDSEGRRQSCSRT